MTSLLKCAERQIIHEPRQFRKRIEISLLQFNDKVVDIPVVAQKQISMILTVQKKNIEISQLHVDDEGGRCPCSAVVAQVPQVHVVMEDSRDPTVAG